jgi:lipopolysaccharide transport system permease protein
MQTFTDVIKHRFILENLVGKSLKTLYRSMALGFFWSLLNPLIMAAVVTFVQLWFFRGTWTWPTFFLVALIPYNFSAYCLSGCAASVLNNANLVKKVRFKVRFPRQILPISVVITNLVHFGIQASLILLALIVFGQATAEDAVKAGFTVNPGSVLSPNLLWLPVIVTVHLGLSVGLGLLVSGLNVIYRDVQYIVESVLTVGFWLCPLLYDAGSRLQQSPWLYWLYFSNPLSGILDSYRRVLYWGWAPDLSALGLATVLTLLIGALGVRSFWKHEHAFADWM